MPPGLAAGIITGQTDVVSVPSGGRVYEDEVRKQREKQVPRERLGMAVSKITGVGKAATRRRTPKGEGVVEAVSR